MPPALSDSPVGWASGPVGAERKRDLQGRRLDSLDPLDRENGPGPAPAMRTNGALEALLVDLGSQIQRGLPDHEPDRNVDSASSRACPTGLPTLDARLGGGFPRGRLSEICGPASSGRTALALMLLRTTLQQGGVVGWVDLADAFDPISAAANGIALERMLWVRPRCEDEALRSCDRLLQTEGFELIVFDCVSTRNTNHRRGPGRGKVRRNRRGDQGPSAPSISDIAWLRLARLAARTQTAFIVLSEASAAPRPSPRSRETHRSRQEPGAAEDSMRSASMTGSRAALVLEMLPLAARFVGSPSLLTSLETTALLRRHRTRPSGAEIAFSASFNNFDDSGLDPDFDSPAPPAQDEER